MLAGYAAVALALILDPSGSLFSTLHGPVSDPVLCQNSALLK